MIDGDIKKRLLTDLAKSGNIYYACAKVNIGRATFYRWMKTNHQFGRLARLALRNGRANMCDVAEQALMALVREKDLPAIKYYLGHNSPKYKSDKPTKVILEHWRKGYDLAALSQKTLEDLIREDDEMLNNRSDHPANVNVPKC